MSERRIQSEVADILSDERVVEIFHSGQGFTFRELHDEWEECWLTPHQLRQLGQELIAVAEKQIEKNAS